MAILRTACSRSGTAVPDREQKNLQVQTKRKALKNNFLTTGPGVELFEKEFSKKVKSKYSVSSNSGTSAIILALKAINLKKNDQAITILENCKIIIEEYADSYSKNQNIKKESVKRNERINIIDKEIESWKNLLSNSERMVSELSDRKNKLTLQLNKLDNQPKLQAEKKGQISEGLRISEQEKTENDNIINSTDEKIKILRNQLNEIIFLDAIASHTVDRGP